MYMYKFVYICKYVCICRQACDMVVELFEYVHSFVCFVWLFLFMLVRCA